MLFTQIYNSIAATTSFPAFQVQQSILALKRIIPSISATTVNSEPSSSTVQQRPRFNLNSNRTRSHSRTLTPIRRSKVDVVAIHGLNGHALNTWMDGETIWFRDLLPDLVPEASLRVLSYGYSSEFVSSGSRDQMLDFVLGLLSALVTLRRSTSTDKLRIYFICHSLGGILFKKCLLMANERKNFYGSILSSTCGIAFFGTPHRGSGGASLSKICLDIAHAVYSEVRSDLVANLKHTAEELADIGYAIPSLLQGLSIISAYETKPLAIFKVAGKVVGRESALLNLPNEMAIPIDADHRAMCRFSDPDDPRFRPVILAIAHSIREALVVEEPTYFEACQDVLYFDAFQERRMLLPEAHDGTFNWIWTDTSFVEWTRGGSKMLWIQGKPASGKSTMMKYIRQGLSQGPHVPKDNHIVVDFFYSVRGSSVQQQHVWMLRSIIWQILSQYPFLWPEILLLKLYDPRKAKTFTFLKPQTMAQWFSDWLSDENLQKLLAYIYQYDKILSTTIYVIVDAMDESELANRRKIATSLLQLTTDNQRNDGSTIVFKVLVASRPDPMTEVVSDRCIRMIFEDQTDNDIKIYIENSLGSLAEQVPSLRDGDLSKIQKTLQKKSQGVFLWVSLIMSEFEEKYLTEGCSIQEMEDILLSIPSGLDSLYARMFLVIDSQTLSERRETDAILLWTIEKPTSHEEINAIIALSACEESELTELTLPKNRLRSHADIEKRIKKRCVNFVEWKIKKKDQSEICPQQFIAAKYPNIDQLIEFQSIKYTHLLVSFDPSWLKLFEMWPKFTRKALEETDLQAVPTLFATFTPLLERTISRRPNGPDLEHSGVRSRRLCFVLQLAAAVQADHAALSAVGAVGLSNPRTLSEIECFATKTAPPERLYISLTVKPISKWFTKSTTNNLTLFKQGTLFVDLQSIVAMFSDPEKLDELIGLAEKLHWYFPDPGTGKDKLFFLSAARQGNITLARLYFEIWKRETEKAANGRKPSLKSPSVSGCTAEVLTRNFPSNIMSIALDFNQISFATMMIEHDYLCMMEYVDNSLMEERTALEQACDNNLVYIASGIYPRYASPRLDDAGIEKLREKARKRGFMEIVNLFETVERGVVNEEDEKSEGF
ncbi:hypothetical protein VTL71DRAFT_5427 [Oculimacula yallundae]|uniref:Nephrocystin 3-like N-terminal domain-containing protein n=1 Tax=Oculimacula yallundae TaxID=86028 RepID=A0ABR4C139_9HELO